MRTFPASTLEMVNNKIISTTMQSTNTHGLWLVANWIDASNGLPAIMLQQWHKLLHQLMSLHIHTNVKINRHFPYSSTVHFKWNSGAFASHQYKPRLSKNNFYRHFWSYQLRP